MKVIGFSSKSRRDFKMRSSRRLGGSLDQCVVASCDRPVDESYESSGNTNAIYVEQSMLLVKLGKTDIEETRENLNQCVVASCDR